MNLRISIKLLLLFFKILRNGIDSILVDFWGLEIKIAIENGQLILPEIEKLYKALHQLRRNSCFGGLGSNFVYLLYSECEILLTGIDVLLSLIFLKIIFIKQI